MNTRSKGSPKLGVKNPDVAPGELSSMNKGRTLDHSQQKAQQELTLPSNRVKKLRRQWRTWSLPSKLTAIGTLVGVLSLTLYLGEKAIGLRELVSPHPLSAKLPLVALEFRNSGNDAVELQKRGDLVLWLPAGVSGGAPSVPGTYELLVNEGDQSQTNYLTIPASSTLGVSARLLNEIQLAPILESGATDLDLILRRKDGGIIFTGEIPFTRKALETTRWQVEVKTEK